MGLRGGLLLTSALLLGCGGNPDERPELYELAEAASFETTTLLGPHMLIGELERRRPNPEEGGEELVTSDSLEIAWADWDNFLSTRSRDGRTVAQTRVIDGAAFIRRSAGRFRRASDSELHRVELRHGWNFWGAALEPFAGAIAVKGGEESQWEGRPVEVFEVVHREGAVDGVSLSGKVAVDVATSVRLFGELRGSYLENGSPVELRMEFRRVDIGRRPVIERPPTVTATP